MRRRRIAQGASLVGTVALLLGVGATSASARPINESQGFRKAVTVAGIREHQLALQQIADANGGNRAVGTPGYDASVAYIAARAAAAGYEVTSRRVHLRRGRSARARRRCSRRSAPEPQVFVAGSRPAFDGDFVSFTGSGDVTAPVQGVDLVLPPGARPEHLDQWMRDRGLRRLRSGQHRAHRAWNVPLRSEGRLGPGCGRCRVPSSSMRASRSPRCSQQPSARRRGRSHPQCWSELRRRCHPQRPGDRRVCQVRGPGAARGERQT